VIPSRAHGSPPYGQAPSSTSRPVHNAASRPGSSSRRPTGPGAARGIHLYASASGMIPTAVRVPSTTVNAAHGTGPRYRVVQDTSSPKNSNPNTAPTAAVPHMLRPISAIAALVAATRLRHIRPTGHAHPSAPEAAPIEQYPEGV